MRDLLARSGRYEVSRLDDHQLHAASGALLHSAASLRNLLDVATVLAFFSRSVAGDRIGLRQLFDRAIDLLDFSVDRNTGLISPASMPPHADMWKPPDIRLTAQIRAGLQHAGKSNSASRHLQATQGKTVLGETEAGVGCWAGIWLPDRWTG